MKHLRDVRTRHLHTLRKLRLRHPELLHPQQNAPKECRTDFINRLHSLQQTFTSILFPSPHFSHLAAPTLSQPSPTPDQILPFTSAIQPSLSLLPSLHPSRRPSKYKPFTKIALMCFRRLRHHCYAVMTVPKPLAWLCVTTNGILCRARYFANTELDGWRYMLPNPAEITLYADIVKNSSLKFPFEP